VKTSSVYFGTALITAGCVFLLDTLNVPIPAMPWLFSWWPILLILLGISLLVKNPTMSRVNAAIAGLVLGLIISVAAVHPCDDEGEECTIRIGTHQTR